MSFWDKISRSHIFDKIAFLLKNVNPTLNKKCPYSELFWSAFSRIRTEYGEIRSISPYSVQMRENADQNNSEYGHFSRNPHYTKSSLSFCRFKRNMICKWVGVRMK